MNKQKMREVIAESFCDLMKQFPFESITVEQIAERSGVSRATFYRNFLDKYDLMNWFFNWRLNTLIANDPTADLRQQLFKHASLMLEYREYFCKALKTQGQNSFREYLYEFTLDAYHKSILNVTGAESLPDNLLIQIKLFAYGSVYVTLDWLESGGHETPREIADAVFDAIPPAIARYSSNPRMLSGL